MRGRRQNRWIAAQALTLLLVLAGCDTTGRVVGPGSAPDAPRALALSYYAQAVTVTWELGPGWNGESFRVYGKRSTDADYFLIAEVTSCSGSFCTYTDVNVQAGRDYDYYVAAVDAFGIETSTAEALRIFVPQPIAPPAPSSLEVVGLDGSTYLRWNDAPRDADDFAFYRVYLIDGSGSLFLGTTDSNGFLDELAGNGVTSRYAISSVDTQGHESALSAASEGTARPDFEGEVVFDFFDAPAASGFRFREDELQNPIVDGGSGERHFRLETDVDGWWLVPGPGARIYPQGFVTTSLRCGPGSDAGCVELSFAPTSGYVTSDVGIVPSTTYVLQVPGDDGALRYGVLRVELLGFDQENRALMVFDWAYQLQPGNPALSRGLEVTPRQEAIRPPA